LGGEGITKIYLTEKDCFLEEKKDVEIIPTYFSAAFSDGACASLCKNLLGFQGQGKANRNLNFQI
jgi:hypothetical protein